MTDSLHAFVCVQLRQSGCSCYSGAGDTIDLSLPFNPRPSFETDPITSSLVQTERSLGSRYPYWIIHTDTSSHIVNGLKGTHEIVSSGVYRRGRMRFVCNPVCCLRLSLYTSLPLYLNCHVYRHLRPGHVTLIWHNDHTRHTHTVTAF